MYILNNTSVIINTTSCTFTLMIGAGINYADATSLVKAYTTTIGT